MSTASLQPAEVTIHPVTAERWPDLAALFGERGAYAGCWCMNWRLDRARFKRQKGDGNRETLRTLVESDDVPGLLAYVGDVPAGWCSIGPRERYVALENSRILKRVDAQPVWSIVCFFVAKPFRRRGLMVHLLTGAVRYAAAHGARIIEGYPIDMEEHLTGFAGYMGFAAPFRAVGFVEIGRASTTQLIMRYTVSPGAG
jgi:GNAT superfamily N-acetyltransferase